MTPEQGASAELAEAAFRAPAIRAAFELMAKQTSARPPVPDDPAWLNRGEADRAAVAVIDKLWDARYALVGDEPGYDEGYLDGIEHAARVVREMADGAS